MGFINHGVPESLVARWISASISNRISGDDARSLQSADRLAAHDNARITPRSLLKSDSSLCVDRKFAARKDCKAFRCNPASSLPPSQVIGGPKASKTGVPCSSSKGFIRF